MADMAPGTRDLEALRRRLLDARDERQAAIDQQLAAGHSVIFVGTNIPGAEKSPCGVDGLMGAARLALARRLPVQPVGQGRDALGPWALYITSLDPHRAKREAIALEDTLPGGRLLDLDVYTGDGRRVGRVALGVPPRLCLVCNRPAADCIRLRRHLAANLEAAVARLLPAGA